MIVNFVGQKIRNINGYSTIETGMRNASRVVVVRDRLNREVRESPQCQQVCAYFRVRCPKQFLFSFEGLASTFAGTRENGTELVGHRTRQEETSNIVEKCRHGGDIASFSVQRERADNGGCSERMKLHGFAIRSRNMRAGH